MSAGLLRPNERGQPALPKDKVPVKAFLNKLLGMRLRDQQLIFDFFASALDKVGAAGWRAPEAAGRAPPRPQSRPWRAANGSASPCLLVPPQVIAAYKALGDYDTGGQRRHCDTRGRAWWPAMHIN